MERETGFEPATSTLARSHSTTELFPLARTLTVPHGRVRVQGRRRRSGAFHAQSAAVFLRAGGTELGAASEAWAPVAAPACSAFFNVSIRSRCRSLRFLLIWNRERSPLRLDIIEPFVKETGVAEGATHDGVTFRPEGPRASGPGRCANYGTRTERRTSAASSGDVGLM